MVKKRLLGILNKYKIPKLNLPHSFFWEDLEEGKNTREDRVTPKADLGFSPGKRFVLFCYRYGKNAVKCLGLF